MRNFITLALIAAAALPAAAGAQSRGELRRDRQEIREERRDLERAYRRGDRGDIRDARRDLRDARQEYREDLRGRYGRDDWRRYRNSNRGIYARGDWRAPFGYQRFRPGGRISNSYYGSRYVIANPGRYRLPPLRPNTRWVRHYNDVLLVDYRRGIVLDVLNGFYW